MIFSYSVTATRTSTFWYIKRTPDFVFTGIFPDIVFGQFFRQRMEKKLPPKTKNEPIVTSFFWEILLMVSCLFLKNERLECEIKIYLGYYSTSHQYHIIKNIIEATISRFFPYPHVGVVFENLFF